MIRRSILRVITHWTAGGPRPSTLDRQHYHYLIDQNGEISPGLHPVSANSGSLVSGRYAAHTRSFNTGSIGVALCGMAGAQERPFDPGRWPLTETQVSAAWGHIAAIMAEHGLQVSQDTLFTHAEAEPLHGVKQAGKWDVTWLPGMDAPGDPIAVGDTIRAAVAARMGAASEPAPDPARDLGELWEAQQRLLIEFGKNPGPVDGIPGPKTLGALRALVINPPK